MAPPAAVASYVKYVRLLNVLTALVQLLAGLGSLTEIFSLDVPATFIAVYVMLFALLLLAFECRLPSTDAFLRANFGFLYSLRGLGAYLLFVGLLDFGMAGSLFGYVAGASACFTAFVVLSTSVCTGANGTTAATTKKPLPEDQSAFNSSSDRLPTYGSSSFASSAVPSAAATVAKPTLATTTTAPPPPQPLLSLPSAVDPKKKGKNKK